MKDKFTSPDLQLEFTSPKSLNFSVINTSKKLAKKPLYGFGIFDLDVNPVSPLPIPVQETSYLRRESYQGPNGLISEYGTIGHRYFGFAYVTCENCTSERWHWIYSIKGNKDKSWYIELDHSEPKF